MAQVKVNDKEKKKSFHHMEGLFFHRFKYLTKASQHRPIQICWQALKPLSRLDPTHPRLIYKHILKFSYIFLQNTFVYTQISLASKHTHMQKHAVSSTNTRGQSFSHIQTKCHHQYAYVAIYITAEIVISSLVRPLTCSRNTLSLSVRVRSVWTYCMYSAETSRSDNIDMCGCRHRLYAHCTRFECIYTGKHCVDP